MTQLRRNYRALPCILTYYDQQFYDSQLIATLCPETSIEAKKLNDLNGILPKRESPEDGSNKKPFGICFVNVDGRNERMQNKKSWENKDEVHIVRIKIFYFFFAK